MYSHDSTVLEDPWENILLGGFVFSLGYRFGVAGLPRSVFSPNMLAHTPIDPYLGDFLGKSDCKGFLVELKRNWGQRRTEQNKEKFKMIQSMERLAEARSCHFMGYGYETSPGEFDLKFGNYLSLVFAKTELDEQCYSLDEFLQGIVEDRIGANSDDFRNYLGQLTELLRNQLTSGSAAKRKVAQLDSALRGVAILYTHDGFFTQPFSSFTSLTKQIGMAHSIELYKEVEKIRSRSREINKEIGF